MELLQAILLEALRENPRAGSIQLVCQAWRKALTECHEWRCIMEPLRKRKYALLYACTLARMLHTGFIREVRLGSVRACAPEDRAIAFAGTTVGAHAERVVTSLRSTTWRRGCSRIPR